MLNSCNGKKTGKMDTKYKLILKRLMPSQISKNQPFEAWKELFRQL